MGDVRSYNAAIMRLGSEDKISVTSKDSSKLYFFFSWVNHVVGSALKRDRNLGGSWKKDIFDVQALRELMTKLSFISSGTNMEL